MAPIKEPLPNSTDDLGEDVVFAWVTVVAGMALSLLAIAFLSIT